MELTATHSRKLWLCYKIFCGIFSKGTQPFDFTKHNLIRELAYKVKYIIQINRGLIMFFRNSRITFFKISWLNCGQYGKNHYKEKEDNQHISML